MQVTIDAGTRLTVAVGRPVPGSHNDCTAFRDSGIDQACRGAHVMADGGYQGNPQVIMPYRKASPRRRAARVETAAQHRPQTRPRPD